MTTCKASGDDKDGFMTTLGFQCNGTPNTWPMFFDTLVLSMIICYLIYSTILNILSKCDMYQYFTLGLNILVNVYSIFGHFAAYNIFVLNCRFKQPGQLISREHMLFPCMQRVCIIVITTGVTKCTLFGCFVHTITRISIWWIYDRSGSDINQMPC